MRLASLVESCPRTQRRSRSSMLAEQGKSSPMLAEVGSSWARLPAPIRTGCRAQTSAPLTAIGTSVGCRIRSPLQTNVDDHPVELVIRANIIALIVSPGRWAEWSRKPKSSLGSLSSTSARWSICPLPMAGKHPIKSLARAGEECRYASVNVAFCREPCPST